MSGLLDTAFVKGFVLVLARTGAVMAGLPILGDRWLPARVRIVLVATLGILLTAMLPNRAVSLGAVGFAVACARELALGSLVGLLLRVGLAGVQGAGNVIALQMGIGLRGVIDPGGGLRGSILAGLLYLSAGAIWLGLDMHHDVLRALAYSLRELPPGGWTLSPETGHVLVMAAGRMFQASLTLLAPVLGAMLVANLLVGLIGRAAPRMNMLIVGFPVLIGIGLLASSASLLVWGPALRAIFTESLRDIGRLIVSSSG